jgi:hypothetical protein
VGLALVVRAARFHPRRPEGLALSGRSCAGAWIVYAIRAPAMPLDRALRLASPARARGRLRALVPSLFALAALSLASPACVEPKCSGDRDCGSGKVCYAATGSCVTPECETHAQCRAGTVCERRSCVAGCLAEADCDAGTQCVENRCTAFEQQCHCPLAPAFCLADRNPASPTSGTQVCLPGASPGGTVLFFGSVVCSHCQGIFSVLLAMQGRLRAEGASPRLLWVQLAKTPMPPETIAAAFAGVDAPVLQDVAGIDVWDAYHVDWYYVVVLDTHGCVAGRFGPLTTEQVQGAMGPVIEGTWRTSMTPACPATAIDAGTPPASDSGPDSWWFTPPGTAP